ncbi:hypothetical protein N7527_006207 [Penicillium freii]|uniref:Retrotransposon gag domain-containing protein n=1 Tax=Penicillium freii TaxID=48697 RepID=A0A101MAA4_PENFR|nr:hypothetical protein N7527_006207 [Penicillium freii]KUM56848.1 hypothetical protein ACN42_g10354 [Penicillium freii]
MIPHPLEEETDIEMSTFFRVKTFQGLQEGFEDPIDFIEDIETVVEREYACETLALNAARRQTSPDGTESLDSEEKALREKMDRVCRILFRQNVSGRAETWYNWLGCDIKRDWKKLREICLERYRLPEEDLGETIWRMEVQYDGLRQSKDETITQYLERADDFYDKYGPQKSHLGFTVVQGLRESNKRDLLLFHLRQEKQMDYVSARKLIADAYSGVSNPFI